MTDATNVQELGESLNKAKQLSIGEAAKFDPVKLCFIESLAAKLAASEPVVQSVLNKRLLATVKQYLHDFKREKNLASVQLEKIYSEYPTVSEAAETLFAEGDFKALKRLYTQCYYRQQVTGDSRSALRELTQELNNHSPKEDDDNTMANLDWQLQAQEDEAVKTLIASDGYTMQTGELKSIRAMRSSLGKINALTVVDQSIESRPINAGPLNPENLTTKSLEEIKKLSPAYLNRFITYADTLLWLQQFTKKKAKTRKK